MAVPTVLLNGQPCANQAIVLYSAGDPEGKLDKFFVTGADGHATITLDHAGAYMLAARYRGAAPPDSGVAVRSYTTTLTFEAMDALPVIQAIVNAPAEQAHRRANRHTTRELFH